MKKICSVLLLISLLYLTGCAPKMLTKSDAFPNHYKEMPLSVLVLPPINTTTAADAREFYATTIAEPLSFSGYYVHSTELVMEVLRFEGIPDSELLLDIPPQKFKEYFGADAVLYTTINKWNTSYYVIGGNVTVGLNFLLKSTNTSDILWKYSGEMTVDTTGENRVGGLLGLALQLAETAIKSAATDYTPIAKKINYMVLNTIPYGRYHELHNTDQGYQIVMESKVKDKE
jgi:hypothetical protein